MKCGLEPSSNDSTGGSEALRFSGPRVLLTHVTGEFFAQIGLVGENTVLA